MFFFVIPSVLIWFFFQSKQYFCSCGICQNRQDSYFHELLRIKGYCAFNCPPQHRESFFSSSFTTMWWRFSHLSCFPQKPVCLLPDCWCVNPICLSWFWLLLFLLNAIFWYLKSSMNLMVYMKKYFKGHQILREFSKWIIDPHGPGVCFISHRCQNWIWLQACHFYCSQWIRNPLDFTSEAELQWRTDWFHDSRMISVNCFGSSLTLLYKEGMKWYSGNFHLKP